jgi:hypothetical protein
MLSGKTNPNNRVGSRCIAWSTTSRTTISPSKFSIIVAIIFSYKFSTSLQNDKTNTKNPNWRLLVMNDEGGITITLKVDLEIEGLFQIQ